MATDSAREIAAKAIQRANAPHEWLRHQPPRPHHYEMADRLLADLVSLWAAQPGAQDG